MAFLQRYLITALLAVLFPVAASALPPDAAKPSFKVVLLSAQRDIVSGLLYDFEGRQIKLRVSTERLSRAYPIPKNGTVSLYRESPAPVPSDPPIKTPAGNISFQPGGPWFVFMSTTAGPTPDAGPDIQTKVIDASLEQQPRGMVTIYNFCRAQVALKTVDLTFELAPGQSRQISYPPPPQTALWLKCAILKRGKWSLEISSPRAIVQGDTRAIWLVYEQPPSPENPTETLTLRNLIEPVPAPKAE